ncbi:hypothetical protein FRC07_000600, partial [Ceratobasidium sp. 392]
MRFTKLALASTALLAPLSASALSFTRPDALVLNGESPISAQTRWTWEDCGLETDIVHVKSIEVSPDPPQPGKDMTVTVVGTADTEIEASLAVDSVRYRRDPPFTPRFNMWNNGDSPPNPSLAHGFQGFIHQPKPRAPNTVFRFSDSATSPPDPACSLPTPTSSPLPRSKNPSSHLTIDHLVQCEAELEHSDTLGRALAALPPTSSGYNLVTLNREEAGEFILSARSFGCNDISDTYKRVQSGLNVPKVAPTELPKVTRAAPSSSQAYLTPPSSPETGPECDPAHDNDVDSLSLDTESTVVDGSPNERTDPTDPKKHKLHNNAVEQPNPTESEHLDLDWYEDDDSWLESDDELDASEDDEALTEIPMSPTLTPVHSRLFSPNTTPDTLPEADLPTPAHLADLRNFTVSPVNVPDLTTALDLSSFPEWPIARGGFGEVWKGDMVCDGSKLLNADSLDERAGFTARRRAIAVKRLTMYSDAGQEGARKILKRTAREIHIWSRLRHRNILPLLGICSFRGGIGIVSPWQKAGSATAWVNQNPAADRLELCEGICAGLAYLHDNNVIHGDLRGANVLISPSGTPRLIDFGLANIVGGISGFSVSSTIGGTVRWMAPELQVVESQGITAETDVFAFGMTMLELFTGAPPFSEIKNDVAVLLKYQHGERPSRPTAFCKNFA